MKKYLNMNALYITAAVIAVSALLLPRAIEAFNLHQNGISYIAEQTEKYYKITEPIEGEFLVELDLNNLESNEGAILFDDGESRISVSEVLLQDESGYEVVFRSYGTERLDGAVLVSGIDHARTETGFTHSIEAVALASNDDKTYELIPSNSTGWSYKDGDQFGFYLDPPTEDDAIVTVEVTNLQLNLWVEIR